MAGLPKLKNVYESEGKDFLNLLLDDYVLVTEKLDGSKLSVQKKREYSGVDLYKRDDRFPIDRVDRTLMVYYEKAFEHFESLSSDVIQKMPEDWRFSFQYFVNESPHQIEYSRVPKNHLILTNILIKDVREKTTRIVDDPRILLDWSEILETEKPPIIFRGYLSDEQKKCVHKVARGNFKFDDKIGIINSLIKVLNPKIKSSTLHEDLTKPVDSLVFKFVSPGRKTFSFKVVDEVAQELYESLEISNRGTSDTYSIIIVDILEFVQQRGLRADELLSGSPDQRYLQLVSALFNEYVVKNGHKYEGINFDTPAFADAEEFALNSKMLTDDKTREIVDGSETNSKLFKIFLSSFRKKRTKTTSIITETMVAEINNLVDRIRRVTEMDNDSSFRTFDKYLELKELSEASDETEILINSEIGGDSIPVVVSVRKSATIPTLKIGSKNVDKWAVQKEKIQKKIDDKNAPIIHEGMVANPVEIGVYLTLEDNNIELCGDDRGEVVRIDVPPTSSLHGYDLKEERIMIDFKGDRIKVKREEFMKGNWEVHEPIREGLTVKYPDQGKKKVNIFVGRFQPFTLGHVKVFQELYKQNGLPVVIFIVRAKKHDPVARPFDEDIQLRMFRKLKKSYTFIEDMKVIDSAAIDKIFNELRPAYEPVLWGTGTDRFKSYGYQINKSSYRKELGVLPEFEGYEIKRGDKDVSATKVRDTLTVGNQNRFQKLTPKAIHDFYDELRKILAD